MEGIAMKEMMTTMKRRQHVKVFISFLLTLCLALAFVSGTGAVGTAGCGTFYQEPWCREDCGSCGQPCCALQWTIRELSNFCEDRPDGSAAISASDTLRALQSRVFNASSNGGYDGRFSLVSISPPDLLNGGSTSDPFYACTAASVAGPTATGTIPCALVQGEHRPAGSRQVKYTNKISVAIFSSAQAETTVKAFIISPFILSTCDAGENYL
eukprot:427543-Hanusia_phi.AAC.1